jgi:hypothetical protein
LQQAKFFGREKPVGFSPAISPGLMIDTAINQATPANKENLTGFLL